MRGAWTDGQTKSIESRLVESCTHTGQLEAFRLVRKRQQKSKIFVCRCEARERKNSKRAATTTRQHRCGRRHPHGPTDWRAVDNRQRPIAMLLVA